MIVAEQVEQAVSQQKAHLRQELALSAFGLTGSGVERNHDITERARATRAMHGAVLALFERKREHVGRAIFVAMLSIQLLNFAVIRQKHAELCLLEAELAQHRIGDAADECRREQRRARRTAQDGGRHGPGWLA